MKKSTSQSHQEGLGANQENKQFITPESIFTGIGVLLVCAGLNLGHKFEKPKHTVNTRIINEALNFAGLDQRRLASNNVPTRGHLYDAIQYLRNSGIINPTVKDVAFGLSIQERQLGYIPESKNPKLDDHRSDIVYSNYFTNLENQKGITPTDQVINSIINGKIDQSNRDLVVGFKAINEYNRKIIDSMTETGAIITALGGISFLARSRKDIKTSN
jgi:hypothetical protein